MARSGTGGRPETGHGTVYDLVVIPGSAEVRGIRRATPAHAGFLTQLLVGADPAMRPSRLERTRSAAATYAAMGRPSA